MKSKFYTLLVAGAGLFLISCKTASKLYEKGRYDEAVEKAAKKLQKDPADPQLREILQSAYRYAVDDHENRIRNNEASSNELKWEWMYAEYVSLQRLYEAIYKVPEVFTVVRPTDYSADVMSSAEKAGRVRYERGLSFMQRSDKQSYRQAYREFKAALVFIPGDRDAMQQMNEAFEYAVTNVAVLPLQQDGGYVYSSYIVGGNNLDDQLIRSLQFDSGNEFVRFYSAWEARSRHIRIDQELEMQLATRDIGRFRDARSTRKVSKEIVVKETVYKPDSVVRQYAKVSAEIYSTRRTLDAAAVLRITIRDADGRWIRDEDLPATFAWSTEFSTFTGDERALSDSDKQLISRPRENAPSENEIMRCLLEEISRNASYRVKNYYSRL